MATRDNGPVTGYSADDVAAVIRAAFLRKFHVENSEWPGHGTIPDNCYACQQFAHVAAGAVAGLLARAGQESER